MGSWEHRGHRSESPDTELLPHAHWSIAPSIDVDCSRSRLWSFLVRGPVQIRYNTSRSVEVFDGYIHELDSEKVKLSRFLGLVEGNALYLVKMWRKRNNRCECSFVDADVSIETRLLK
jgi:hypothetical protein